MDARQVKEDVEAGRIDVDRLIDLIDSQQRLLREMKRQLEDAQRRIAELEKKLGPQTSSRVEGSFSVQAEERRPKGRGHSAFPLELENEKR